NPYAVFGMAGIGLVSEFGEGHQVCAAGMQYLCEQCWHYVGHFPSPLLIIAGERPKPILRTVVLLLFGCFELLWCHALDLAMSIWPHNDALEAYSDLAAAGRIGSCEGRSRGRRGRIGSRFDR